MNIPLYSVHVRRDAMTTTTVAVPKHEIEILQTIFGLENVHNARYERIDEVGPGKSVGSFVQDGDEWARLCGKYGDEVVSKVYPNKKSLADAVEKPAAKAKAAATKAEA